MNKDIIIFIKVLCYKYTHKQQLSNNNDDYIKIKKYLSSAIFFEKRYHKSRKWKKEKFPYSDGNMMISFNLQDQDLTSKIKKKKSIKTLPRFRVCHMLKWVTLDPDENCSRHHRS